MFEPLRFSSQLPLLSCPHCGVNRPSMKQIHMFQTRPHTNSSVIQWAVYACSDCGGAVLAKSDPTDSLGTNVKHVMDHHPVTRIFPEPKTFAAEVPEEARYYLIQAQSTLHSPSASVVMSASAVDAMLQLHNVAAGKLYDRINKAAEIGLITREMAIWAHDVRLESNFPRHADKKGPRAEQQDAERCLDFAEALGEMLFVLPARVKRGRKEANPAATSEGKQDAPSPEPP